MEGAMLELREITLSYQGNLILDKIDMRGEKGEIIVITGQSGVGKSTIIKMLNGIIPEIIECEMTGEIKYDGNNIIGESITERSHYISTVFQNPKTQFYCINSTDELAFALENKNLPREEILEKIDKYTKKLHIAHLLNRDIFTLSGGEKQLLAITSVACMENDIYLFDEPSASLDKEAIVWLKNTLQTLKSMGKIVIVVEHRLYYLKEILDHLYVVEHKKILHYTKERLEKQDKKTIESSHNLRSFDEVLIDKKDITTIILNKKYDYPIQENETVLYCKHFQVKYNKNVILDCDISFSNDIYYIIGKNGVGKSTFVKKLCNLIGGKGEVYYKNKKIKKSYEYISLVMQDVNYQIFTETVWQEISIVSDDETEKEKVLKELGLWEKREYHPQILSGGEKQRLLIGMAKVSTKPIVILDEPTSGLDKKQVENMARYLQEMKEQGKIVFVITHDYELIQSCKGRVLEFVREE